MNCDGVPDDLRGLEVIREDVEMKKTELRLLMDVLQLGVHLWACLVSFHNATSTGFVERNNFEVSATSKSPTKLHSQS